MTKDELEKQDIRLNKLCFDYQEKEKRIEELEKENAELRNNGFTVSAMTEQQLKVALEKGEQLEKENAELKGIKDVATLIKANNDTVVTLMQLNNKLVSKSQQLTIAKDLIHQFLIQNPISDWLPKKAEQFLEKEKSKSFYYSRKGENDWHYSSLGKVDPEHYDYISAKQYHERYGVEKMTDITKLDFQDFWGQNEDLFENGLTVSEEKVADKLYNRVISCAEHQIADLKANFDLAIEGRDLKIKELEQQIEQIKSDVIECFGSEYNVLVAKLLNKWEIKEK
jgi:hypothetical protein